MNFLALRAAAISLLCAGILCAADKPAHYAEIWTHADAFGSQQIQPEGPHPPVPIGVSGADCRVLPFYGSWSPTQDTNYACLPYTTIAAGPANTSYLARYNFVVNVFGPCKPQVTKEGGDEPESSCTYSVTNGFQYVSYCTDSTQVTWQSFTTSATNPSSGKIEPAFVVTAVAYSPILEEETMTGTQVTFWNGASILNCNPKTCTSPCY
jgi:hypothetical protein